MELQSTLKRPFFYDCIIEDQTIYFPLANYNAICKGNLINDQVDIINTFPDIPADKRVAGCGMFRSGDVFLFYTSADDKQEVLSYDFLQNTFSKLSSNKNINFRSNTVFEKNGNIYICVVLASRIYKVDLCNNCMSCIVAANDLKENFLPTEITRKDDLIFFPLNQQKVLLIFNLQNEEYETIEFPSNISYVATLCYHNEKLWITGEDRKIYVWDVREKETSACVEFPDEVQPFFLRDNKRFIGFGNSLIYENDLWLFPICTDVIIKYNIMSGNFEKIDIPGEEEVDGSEENRFFKNKYGIVKKNGDKVFFLSSKTRILYELNLVTNNIHKHDLKVKDIYNGKIYPPPMDGIMMERLYTSGLESMLRSVELDTENVTMSRGDQVGEAIYKYING